MNMVKVGMMLEALCSGVDPRTGELLEAGHVCRDAQVRRALEEALTLVKLRAKDLPVEYIGKVEEMYINRSGRLSASRPWTPEDDDMLRQLWRRKASMKEMCTVLQRRERGIQKRVDYLVSLKKCPLPDDLDAPSPISRAGLAWSEKEDEHLQRMVRLRMPLETICTHLGRSEMSVNARLKKYGLLAESIEQSVLK